jgi:hypothetical protein
MVDIKQKHPFDRYRPMIESKGINRESESYLFQHNRFRDTVLDVRGPARRGHNPGFGRGRR